MLQLTREEQILIAVILLSVLLGSTVKHFRNHRAAFCPPPSAQVANPAKAGKP